MGIARMEPIKDRSLSMLVSALTDIVGPSHISDEPYVRVLYQRDQAVLSKGRTPDIVVRPGCTEEIQRVIRLANETRTPVYVRGTYTSPIGYYPIEGGLVLDMTLMNRLLAVDEASLTCTVEPGITWGELEAELYKHGYSFLVAPEGSLGGTVGGHVSPHGCSPTCFLISNQGDCVTGLRVVLPNGELVTTGAAAISAVKSHFMRYSYLNDLTGLFLGAEGTLGVITEIGLKIEALPEAAGHAAYSFDTIDEAGQAYWESRRARIPAWATMLHDGETLDMVDPDNAPHPSYMISWARIGGSQVVVEDALRQLERIAASNGGHAMGPGVPARYWSERYRAAAGFMFALGNRMTYPILVPLGEIPRFYRISKEIAGRIMAEENLKVITVGHSCDRGFMISMSIATHEQDEEEWQRCRKAYQRMKNELLDSGASFYRVGFDFSADQMYRTGPYFDLVKQIKASIDPNHIMCPGYGGL